jgi:hypothetical protein
MEHLTRHLVSRHLGRIQVHVDIDKPGEGSVYLELSFPRVVCIEFFYLHDAVREIFGRAPNTTEILVRLAVSQAHRLYTSEQIGFARQVERLDLHGQPWIGDLLFEPFGGATYGVAAADGTAPEQSRGPVETWPGFCDRLKRSLRRLGCRIGPRSLASQFNQRTRGHRVNVRIARHWLNGLATPAPEELRVLASWLGVSAGWLQSGQIE